METDNGGRADNFSVSEYYNYTLLFYRVFWHGGTRGIHYGYFDKGTKTLKGALIRMNEKVTELLELNSSDVVADLGCGVGGTAFLIAQRIGAHVQGITISSEQYKKALELRKRWSLQEKTTFTRADFFESGLESNHFDAVYGLESLCYAQHDPDRISKEIYRITKPGGRVVIADGFLGKDHLNEDERRGVKTFCEGFALTEMCTPRTFMQALERQGFAGVTFVDWNEHVLGTAKKMWRMTLLWHWFIWLVTPLFDKKRILLKNNRAGLVQKELFSNRVLIYGAIYAEKP